MRLKSIGIIFICLLLPLSALAKPDYKCHVSLSNAESIIMAHFAESAAAAKKELKNRFIIHNKRRLRINHIFECVLMLQPFKSEEARILQKNTRL